MKRFIPCSGAGDAILAGEEALAVGGLVCALCDSPGAHGEVAIILTAAGKLSHVAYALCGQCNRQADARERVEAELEGEALR